MKHQVISLSVVIPLYNKAAHIQRTLMSVLEQSSAVDEVVVVDDGSTDHSARIVKELIGLDPRFKRVRLIGKENGGVSTARNRGIQGARGTHIAFLDADDEWCPSFIAEIRSLIEAFPQARAFASNYYKQDAHRGTFLPKIRFCKKLPRQSVLDNYFSICSRGDLPFMTSSICIEKSLLRQVGGFPENEPMGEDQDVWSKVALKSEIAYSNQRLSIYHLEASNRACVTHYPQTECPFSRRLKRAVDNGRVPAHLRQAVLRYTATHLLYLAGNLMRTGKLAAGKAMLSDSRTRLLPLKRMALVTEYYLRKSTLRLSIIQSAMGITSRLLWKNSTTAH